MSDSYGRVTTLGITRSNRATIATLCYIDLEHDLRIRVTGEALLHPGDKRNPEIGDQLALARAYESLARRLRRRAEGLVKHYDDMNKDKNTVTLESSISANFARSS